MSRHNGECHLQIDTCHLPLQGSNYELLWLLLSPPERSPEWRSGMRPSVLWANWQNRSSDRYFQEKILWAQFLHLFICRKALKSFMVMSAPCDCSNLIETSRKLQKICASLQVFPFTKVTCIYWLSPIPLWNSFLVLSEMLSPGL